MSDSEEEIGEATSAQPQAASSGLFDDSDSDDDIAQGTSKEPSASVTSGAGSGSDAPKKKRLQKKSDKKRLQKKSDSGGGDGVEDLQDSGDEEVFMSKKERMEALAKKRSEPAVKVDFDMPDEERERKPKKHKDKKKDKERKKDKGYESGDSYNSGQFVRTKEDDDFIDADDEDPEALKELYAEQHFEDERPDGSDSEDDEGRRKKKRSHGSARPRKRGPDAVSDDEGEMTSHPLMSVVYKMKRRKKEKKKLSELEEETKDFLAMMDNAADEDEKAFQEKRPATKKLAILTEVLEKLANKEYTRTLLDYDLLSIIKRWIQPLPNGSLGNVTVRHRLLESIQNMNGEQGITPSDLKRSSLGKTVMMLYTHRSETPKMKRKLKELIEQWSRPIFQKSGNMKDLEKVLPERREAGMAGIARAQQASITPSPAKIASTKNLSSIIAGRKGKSGTVGESNAVGSNRVRVPYSKGFQFTVRPSDRLAPQMEKPKKRTVNGVDGPVGRDFISKRMILKSRGVKKNQRSNNCSIEGRPVK